MAVRTLSRAQKMATLIPHEILPSKCDLKRLMPLVVISTWLDLSSESKKPRRKRKLLRVYVLYSTITATKETVGRDCARQRYAPAVDQCPPPGGNLSYVYH